MRAGPVIGPERRIDSKVALRRRLHSEDDGEKASILFIVAPEREERIVSCSPGWLMMSRIVDAKVDCKLTSPPQATIATRSMHTS